MQTRIDKRSHLLFTHGFSDLAHQRPCKTAEALEERMRDGPSNTCSDSGNLGHFTTFHYICIYIYIIIYTDTFHYN